VRVLVREAGVPAACPRCGSLSDRVHSGYPRRLRDLPVGGREVTIGLAARRLFCPGPDCAAVTFAAQVAAGSPPPTPAACPPAILRPRHPQGPRRRHRRQLDARNQAALEGAAEIPEADLPSFATLTAQQQVLVRRVLSSALGSDDAGVG
jgi:transposase